MSDDAACLLTRLQHPSTPGVSVTGTGMARGRCQRVVKVHGGSVCQGQAALLLRCCCCEAIGAGGGECGEQGAGQRSRGQGGSAKRKKNACDTHLRARAPGPVAALLLRCPGAPPREGCSGRLAAAGLLLGLGRRLCHLDRRAAGGCLQQRAGIGGERMQRGVRGGVTAADASSASQHRGGATRCRLQRTCCPPA